MTEAITGRNHYALRQNVGLGLSWVVHNPAATAAIVGARNARQVEQNVGAAELDLTDNDIAEIEGRTSGNQKQQLETNYE